MKADHPRAIDRYIDFFGDVTLTRPPAPPTRMTATADPAIFERGGLAARDEQPRQ